jgi:hypothetical protein
MSQYLAPLVPLRNTTPHPLVQLGGITYGQWSVPLMGRFFHASSIYGLGRTSCVPMGSALRAPVPQDTTSVGPCWPDPEEDISGLHLRHGVWLETLHHPFIYGGRFGSLSSSSPHGSSVPLFWRTHGGSSFSPSPSSCHCGGPSFSSSPVGVMGAMGSSSWLPITHGGSSFSPSPSSCHHEGPSFSSSPVGVMGAIGYLIFISAAYFGGLYLFGHSSICHL